MKLLDIFNESKTYKPFKYPFAYDAWKQQQRIHWLPEEVSLGGDIIDWKVKLNEEDRCFLTHIFRFFTQADIDVASGYINTFIPAFKPIEIRKMLLSFANAETIHISAYALLIESLGLPDSEFSKFLEVPEMLVKHDYLAKINPGNVEELLITLAVYGAFTEGLQLFGSFAMLLNYSRFGKMMGMAQIVTWSVRDESLHAQSLIKLFKVLAQEAGIPVCKLQESINEKVKQIVENEKAFVSFVFKDYKIKGMTKEDIILYIQFLANYRLLELGLQPIYPVKKHPLPWLVSLLNGVEHANFFETTATEYSKLQGTGTWGDAFETLS